MDRQPSRRAVVAVRAVKAAATAAAAGIAVVLTLGGATANPPPGPPASSDASARQVERVGLDARCAGFPGRTLVRTPDGRTRAVAFEQGWRVYRGESPGTLVVVCPE